MHLRDAAALLTVASAFDNRQPNDATVHAWADALDNLDPAMCADAVREHYRESTAFLMPAHIRIIVRGILNDQRQQIAAVEEAFLPAPELRRRIHDLSQQLADLNR